MREQRAVEIVYIYTKFDKHAKSVWYIINKIQETREKNSGYFF